MWRTIISLGLSVGVGVGGTLIYQRVEAHFFPVPLLVHVECLSAEEPINRDALQPIDTTYEGRGRRLQMPLLGGNK